MKRRNFLVGISGVAVISVTGGYLYLTRDLEYDPILAEPFYLSHIWDDETIISNGKIYLTRVSEENDEQFLVKKILKIVSKH